jgi:AraC-like DNA-binding protein
MYRQTYNYLFSIAVLFGGVFSLVLAIGLLVKSRRQAGDRLAFLCLLSIAVWVFSGGLVVLGESEFFPINPYAILVPAFCTAIPLIYLFLRRLLDPARRPSPRDAAHAVLPILSIIAVIPSAGERTSLRTAISLESLLALSRERYFSWALCLAVFITCAYSLRILFTTLRLLRGAARGSRGFLGCIVGVAVFFFLGDIVWIVDSFASLGIRPYMYAAFSLFIVLLYLLGVRYPEFRETLGAEGARLRSTRIGGLDTEAVLARLESLMRDERAYRDPSLSLNSLAECLGISPYQLSELINSKLGKSFPAFVDARRVEDAKMLLLAEKDRKVLDIAFESGFNSSSSFYAVFRDSTGTTPSRFRSGRKAT